MLAFRFWPALLWLFAVGAANLGACKVAPPIAPLIYERLTAGGKFAVVSAVSLDSLGNLPPGRRLTSEESRILATYSRAGLYRTDRPSEPILEIDWSLYPAQILGFFEYDESAYLVVKVGSTIRFYRNGTLVRNLGEREAQEWMTAPWHSGDNSCGSGPGYSLRLDENATRPQLVVETVEGSEFRYDALTGRLVELKRPALAAEAPAMPYERDLAETLSGLLDALKSEEPEEFLGRLLTHTDVFGFQGCEGLEQAADEDEEEMDESDLEGWSWFAALDFQALQTDVHGGQRLIHPGDQRFDLYRPSERGGLRLLCGREAQTRAQLLESLGEEPGSEVYEAARVWLDDAFEAPVVVAVTTWEEPEEGPEGRGGIATLWGRMRGEWRFLGGRVFTIQPER